MNFDRITYRPLVDPATWYAFSRETNDCTVSALAISGRVSYRAAYAFWAWKGRRPQSPVYVPRHLPTLVRRYGKLPVRLSPVPFRPRSITLKTFLRRFPEGRYFVLLCCHAVAVVEGTAFDWNENTRRIVIGAWRVSDSKQSKISVDACRGISFSSPMNSTPFPPMNTTPQQPIHTPVPYILWEWTDERSGSHGFDIEAHPDFNANLPVAVCSGPDCAANAAFIVRACNSHDALVGLLKRCVISLETTAALYPSAGFDGLTALAGEVRNTLQAAAK